MEAGSSPTATKMKVSELKDSLDIPEGVQISIADGRVTVKGSKGEASRKFSFPRINVSVEGGELLLSSKDATRREKTNMGTIKAHIRNMIKGVTEGHVYRLKICSGHFPMNVSINGDVFTIKNFLGEKVPRTLKVKEGAKVKIDGTEVIVESVDIEAAGQVAADIEQLTRITNKDIRIFQDGIYIIEKSKRKLD